MKLASLKTGGRDGTLSVVDRDLTRYLVADEVAPTLQRALEEWDTAEPKLRRIYEQLNSGDPEHARAFDVDELASPLPRAYEFLDGSAYLPHVERVRKARNAEVPESFYTDPLMYQATSAEFLGPRDAIPVESEDFGIDFEAEIVVVTTDVPMGASPAVAADHIALVGLVNDVSLRNLIPGELKKGFGFLQSKPRSAFSPVFVTPDELGDAWQDTELHLPVCSWLNGEYFGDPEAGDDMQFNFAQLVAHAAKTRPLRAGAIVGSGTIANQDTGRGASCLAEKRMLEIIDSGEASTPFLQYGDRVRIEMLSEAGETIFGAIEQSVERYTPPS